MLRSQAVLPMAQFADTRLKPPKMLMEDTVRLLFLGYSAVALVNPFRRKSTLIIMALNKTQTASVNMQLWVFDCEVALRRGLCNLPWKSHLPSKRSKEKKRVC